MFLPSGSASDVFTVAAIAVGLSLSLATIIEGTAGIRNLIRVDILILWVLYGLTFLEFLFPQPTVDALVSPAAAIAGTNAVLVGFAGILIGRHVVARRGGSRQVSTFDDVRPSEIFMLFVLTTLLGYLHVLVAVDFDLFEVLRQMSLPRFAQSWGRGKYGDAYALFVEVGALTYLIPPIAGLVYARTKEYKLAHKVVVSIVLLFTFYWGFALGTRSAFVIYVITFVGAYFLSKPRITLGQVLSLGVPTVALVLVGIVLMLNFRKLGLGNFSFQEERFDTLFIDFNLVSVSNLTEVFPKSFEFLGFEVPFNALIRPIPRVLWPGKPEGLSTSIESALGAGPETSISCTFVGEAYMAAGLLGVLLAGLFFGAVAEMWNRVGRDVNLPFAHIVYASGFLSGAVAMRSMLWMAPVMLPTLALWLYSKFWLSRSSRRRLPAAINPNQP